MKVFLVKKVEKKGLQKAISGLRAQGLSYRGISGALQAQGAGLSHMAVKRYIDSDAEVKRDIIGQREELQEKLARQQLDVYQEIIDVHKIVKKKIEELANTTEHAALVRYAQELRGQIELMSRLLGQLSPIPSVQVNQVFVENNLGSIVDKLPDKKVDELLERIRSSEKQRFRWTILTQMELIDSFRRIQEELWFEGQEMEEKDGKLVLNRPNLAILDDFRKWKRKKETGPLLK